MKKILFTLLITIIFFSSCSIVKRYDTGYSINWHKNKFDNYEKHNQKVAIKFKPSDIKIEDESTIASTEINENIATENVVASTENNIVLLEKNERIIDYKIASINVKSKTKNISAQAFTISKVSANPAGGAWLWRLFKKKSKSSKSKTPLVVLILLSFIFPPLAVGFATKFKAGPVILSFFLTMLLVVPGIIHALIVSSKKQNHR